MHRSDVLLSELTGEAQTTRRHLVRLPQDRFDWRPHPKSSTAGQLASHLVECVGFATAVFSGDEYRVELATYRPFRATTSAALLEGFEAEVRRATDAIAKSEDRDATASWRMLVNGKPMIERAREAAFRDMALNHLVHHRGQLSVYLRLMGVAVPSTYGPTADER